MSARRGRGASTRDGARGREPRRGRGRLLVAAALVGFVLVGAAVIWRRGVGIARARELRALASERAQLVAERSALESAVRAAAGRSRIAGAAEQRLGMRVPADTQVVLLVRPAETRGSAAAGGRAAAVPVMRVAP